MYIRERFKTNSVKANNEEEKCGWRRLTVSYAAYFTFRLADSDTQSMSERLQNKLTLLVVNTVRATQLLISPEETSPPTNRWRETFSRGNTN